MKKHFEKGTWSLEDHYQGKETGAEQLAPTEQDYLPVSVQVNRYIEAGYALKAQKRELYDIGWDENFKMNNIVIPPGRISNFDRIDAQEELNAAQERLTAAQAEADRIAADDAAAAELASAAEPDPEPIPE